MPNIAEFGARDGFPFPRRGVQAWVTPSGNVCPINMWDSAAPMSEKAEQDQEAKITRQMRDAGCILYLAGDPACEAEVKRRRDQHERTGLQAAVDHATKKHDIAAEIAAGNAPLIAKLEALIEQGAKEKRAK